MKEVPDQGCRVLVGKLLDSVIVLKKKPFLWISPRVLGDPVLSLDQRRMQALSVSIKTPNNAVSA